MKTISIKLQRKELDVYYYTKKAGFNRTFICYSWLPRFFGVHIFPNKIKLTLSDKKRKGSKIIKLEMTSERRVSVNDNYVQTMIALNDCLSSFLRREVKKNNIYHLSWEEVK